MKRLVDSYNKFKDAPIGMGDKGTVHSYIENVYGHFFGGISGIFTRLLEVGVAGGYSAKMWNDYFEGDVLQYTGVDIDLSQVADIRNFPPNMRFFEGDATDQKFLDGALKDWNFDYIIDDASHALDDQIKTYEILAHRCKGFYFIEDIGRPEDLLKYFWKKKQPVMFYDGRRTTGRKDDCVIVIDHLEGMF